MGGVLLLFHARVFMDGLKHHIDRRHTSGFPDQLQRAVRSSRLGRFLDRQRDNE